MLTIGEAAQLLDTTPRTLRFYHERGLVPEPERDGLGHRRYDISTLHALKQLLTLRKLGLPLSRSAGLLRNDDTDFEEELLTWEEEIVRKQRELEEQRLMVVQLRQDRTGSPVEQGWTEWEHALTDRGVPFDLVSREKTAAQLLSILDERDPLRAPLPQELNKESTADVMARLSELSPADEGSPKTDLLIEDFVELVTPLVPTMWEGSAPSGFADKLASELLASFPATQRRLIRQVMARIDKELPPPPW